MAVSVMLPPEKLWGYGRVTAAYNEEPVKSRERIMKHVKELYPNADCVCVLRDEKLSASGRRLS